MESQEPKMKPKKDNAKIVVVILNQCVKAAKRLNALGPRATYSQVTHARGLNEIAAHQLAMFAPQILKLVRAGIRAKKGK